MVTITRPKETTGKKIQLDHQTTDELNIGDKTMSISSLKIKDYDSGTGQKVIKLFEKLQRKLEKEKHLQKERKDPRLPEHNDMER